MTGKVIIFSAPSGAGKSTVVNHLLKLHPEFEFSISATSREPRGSEKDGVEYYFISADKFRELIAEDAFVEHEEVYHDRFYGTLKSEVERIWAKGHVSSCPRASRSWSRGSGTGGPTARTPYASASARPVPRSPSPGGASTASWSTTGWTRPSPRPNVS